MTKAVQPKQIIVYATDNGYEPFTDWLSSLRDGLVRKRILARLARLAQGNYGDCEPVGGGVSELRLFFGSGYRIYFGEDDYNLVVLLCGGDKSTQAQDIKHARQHWQEYKDDAKL